jgi:hypothetical protein
LDIILNEGVVYQKQKNASFAAQRCRFLKKVAQKNMLFFQIKYIILFLK